MIYLKQERRLLTEERRRLLLSNLSNSKVRLNQIQRRLAQIKILENKAGGIK